jgi:hypothetical protein
MPMTVAPIIPARTALLLMDFQAPMLNGVPDAETLLARARVALAWARSEHVRVVYVRVAFAPEDFDAVPAHNRAFAAVAQNKFQRRSVDAERRPALLADPGTENSRHLPFEKSKIFKSQIFISNGRGRLPSRAANSGPAAHNGGYPAGLRRRPGHSPSRRRRSRPGSRARSQTWGDSPRLH